MRLRCLRFLYMALLLCIGVESFALVTKKPWTFLVYMAADNSLNYFADLDLQEMQAVGSNNNVNILVYLTIKRDGQEKTTQKLFINKGKVTVLETLPAQDSGNPDIFAQAIQWAITDYPSDHIAVVLWDHGSGPLNRFPMPVRGVCYDDTTGNYLTDVSVQNALTNGMNTLRGGKKFDIIAFDACLMAGVELAFALQPCADFMVGSQETEPGKGFDYKRVLQQLAFSKPDVITFAKSMVSAYGQSYQATQENYTLSAIDLSKLDAVINTSNDIAHMLVTMLQNNGPTVVSALNKSADSGRYFDERDYVDLYTLYYKLNGLNSWLIRSTPTSQLLQDGMKAIELCVIANTTSFFRRSAKGLSVYVPRGEIHPSYAQTSWGMNSAWLSFLNEYTTRR